MDRGPQRGSGFVASSRERGWIGGRTLDGMAHPFGACHRGRAGSLSLSLQVLTRATALDRRGNTTGAKLAQVAGTLELDQLGPNYVCE